MEGKPFPADHVENIQLAIDDMYRDFEGRNVDECRADLERIRAHVEDRLKLLS